jgi:hypothetical protein
LPAASRPFCLRCSQQVLSLTSVTTFSERSRVTRVLRPETSGRRGVSAVAVWKPLPVLGVRDLRMFTAGVHLPPVPGRAGGRAGGGASRLRDSGGYPTDPGCAVRGGKTPSCQAGYAGKACMAVVMGRIGDRLQSGCRDALPLDIPHPSW